MDFLLEIIFGFIFEGSLEISADQKVSKWIRYPLIAIIIAFYFGIVGLFLWLGITMLDKSILGAITIIAIALLLAAMCVVAFKKLYLKKYKRG